MKFASVALLSISACSAAKLNTMNARGLPKWEDLPADFENGEKFQIKNGDKVMYVEDKNIHYTGYGYKPLELRASNGDDSEFFTYNKEMHRI